MFDISFYMNVHSITKRALLEGKFRKEFISDVFGKCRSKTPVVYNIETTNACNMRCKMCPRTTRMTRPIEAIDEDLFRDIVRQIKPWSDKEWFVWKEFCVEEYGIAEGDMSENHFFLYVIPQVIQLHGYGDPLLDKNIDKFVKILSEAGMKTYFSCNPSNINMDKLLQCVSNGLTYIKFSIESVDDERHREIRGEKSNFSKSHENICELLELKKEMGFDTTIIITMLDLGAKDQQEQYERLKEHFAEKDVYIYLKSEDTQWYRQEYHGTSSIHWSEFCKHPWMSMTIKSNGDIAMCMEDYNNEIVLGNAKEKSLYDIWNGEKYRKFRQDHFELNSNIRCYRECDMKMIGRYL